MLFGIGAAVVIGCVLGGYMALGGHLAVLWQPFEFVIICGAALGALIIANPKSLLGKIGGAFGKAIGGEKVGKDSYLELLLMLFTFFKAAKTKGMLTLEAHIEDPESSTLFSNFPHFMKDHHAVEFFCDYMRMITMGSENVNQMEDLMNEELEIHHQEHHKIAAAIQAVADGMPALGIVAAVLGVIKTMGAISQPPEVLGKLIGGALVGTFLGVWISYGFLGPLASSLGILYESESKYYSVMKSGILAFMNGYAPAIAVEFARKSIESSHRPSFKELEAALEGAPTS